MQCLGAPRWFAFSSLHGQTCFGPSRPKARRLGHLEKFYTAWEEVGKRAPKHRALGPPAGKGKNARPGCHPPWNSLHRWHFATIPLRGWLNFSQARWRFPRCRPGLTRRSGRPLTAANSELLNRPGKGATMLAGTMYHGLAAIRYAEEHPERNGISQLQISEEVLSAGKLLQEAHSVTAAEDIKGAVLSLLQYVANPESLENWRRTTILGAHLYSTGQQVLQVPQLRPVWLCASSFQIFTKSILVKGHIFAVNHDRKMLPFRLSPPKSVKGHICREPW